MKTSIALAMALLAASTGLTFAQTPPPPPPGAEATPPPPPGDGPRRGDEEARPDERGPRGDRGPGERRGMGRWERDGASFNLRMGDRRINVACGREELEACIQASGPLLDLVGGAGASGMPMPPPEGLTIPPTPPAPGDTPAPMPGTTPPVAPAN